MSFIYFYVCLVRCMVFFLCFDKYLWLPTCDEKNLIKKKGYILFLFFSNVEKTKIKNMYFLKIPVLFYYFYLLKNLCYYCAELKKNSGILNDIFLFYLQKPYKLFIKTECPVWATNHVHDFHKINNCLPYGGNCKSTGSVYYKRICEYPESMWWSYRRIVFFVYTPPRAFSDHF